MSKGRRDYEDGMRGEPPGGPAAPSAVFVSGLMAGANLAGVAVLILLGYMNWQETRAVQKSLDDRLDKVETRLADLARARPAAAPAREGPDPDRVYSVKTDGAPIKGPAGAPVTIAELSDFQ
jgi:hypothetical protein